MTSSAQIAIVGAGLGGLALSLFLHRDGIKSTIYEHRPRSAQDGGYIALAPNAHHVLDQLGLYDRLLPHGFAYEEITFLSARNLSTIGAVLNGSKEKYGYPALRIARHIVRQTLLKAAEEAGVQVRFSTKVVALEEIDDKVLVTFGNDKTTSFDFVVGADGIHSRVRALISTAEPTFSGQMGIGGGGITRSEVHQNLHFPCMFVGKNNSFMMMPTVADGSEISCFATVEVEGNSREHWAKLNDDKEEIARMLRIRHCDSKGEWPQIVEDACTQSDPASLTIWPYFNVPVLDSWMTASSRIVVIGDAAHAMPPTGGQGAAMAFEDAASLAKVLANSTMMFGRREDMDAWQARRQDRVRQIKAFTKHSGDTRKASPSQLQQIVKEYLMWLFFLVKGKEGGFAWMYSHKEEGPAVVSTKA